MMAAVAGVCMAVGGVALAADKEPSPPANIIELDGDEISPIGLKPLPLITTLKHEHMVSSLISVRVSFVVEMLDAAEAL